MKLKSIVIAALISSAPLHANEALTSTDLLLAQTWLAQYGGQNWKLLYNEIDGKKYQWVITKTVYGDEVYVHFKVGNEIDDYGTVIGGHPGVSDQFFTLIIDKTSYTLKHTGLGG